MAEVFTRKNDREPDDKELIDKLYKQIGKSQVEIDWLKKARTLSLEQRQLFIEKDHKKVSIHRQCELVNFNRSNVYYQHREKDAERDDLLHKEIDKQFMKDPCGVIKMMKNLRRLGYQVGEKLVRWLIREMNLLAIYPKPNLSKPEIFNSDQGSQMILQKLL